MNIEQLQRTAKATSSKKSQGSAEGWRPGEGTAEQFYGLHLYRCWYCKRVLLKPLQCGQCQSIAYCSKECQRAHWHVHRSACADVRDKLGAGNKK